MPGHRFSYEVGARYEVPEQQEDAVLVTNSIVCEESSAYGWSQGVISALF